MKIIHTSDLHIDSPMTAHLSPLQAKVRKKELVTSFRKNVYESEMSGALAYIIAGDFFDSEKVGVRTLSEVLSIIERAPTVTFFYLPGNHERDRLTEVFHTLPKNLRIFGENWTKYTLENVNFYGRTTTEAGMFDSLSLDKNETNIVVLHGELRDKCDTGGIIGKNEAKNKGIDYLALGHYHSYSAEAVDDRLTAVYSGTPEGRGFDEAGPLGYVLITVEDGIVRHEFIRSAKRELHAIKVPITDKRGILEIESAVEAAIAGIRCEDLVRVHLTGYTKPEEKPDCDSIYSAFASRFYYLEVEDNTHLGISVEDYKNDKSLKGEFIRLVLTQPQLSDEEKEKIISCGLKALMGEV